ncbi:MAG: SET domain-containing protein [Acidobacteriota bacterium]
MGNEVVVCEGPAIEVRDEASYKGVFAREIIKRGSVILYLKGTISTQPSKYTIQLDAQRHLNSPRGTNPRVDPDYSWQYLNHCCEPNGYINVSELSLRALRDISPGEEITFNYLTTESVMAMPFTCICGSLNCFGFIQGRNFLTPAQSDILAFSMGEASAVNQASFSG